MNRKDFLKNCTGLMGAGIVLPLLHQSCKGIAYISHEEQDGKIVVKKSDLAEYPFVLVQPTKLPAPVYVCRLENGGYSAVLLQCTHRACEVRPVGGELHCPCHGSVFSKTGEVLESPAERPLRRFEVSSDEYNLYIR